MFAFPLLTAVTNPLLLTVAFVLSSELHLYVIVFPVTLGFEVTDADNVCFLGCSPVSVLPG